MNDNVQLNTVQLLNKKQNYFVAKTSLIAGFLFALIFAISFIIAKYAFISMNNNEQNILITIGSIALIVAIVFSIILSFKGTNASYGFIVFSIAFYCIAFIIMFSAYFSLLGNDIMFYALAFTSLALIITSIVGFIISPKAAFSLIKISGIAIMIYLVISIIGSLLIYFYSSDLNFKIWQIIVTSIIGLSIICSTIYSFYSIKKTSEFINISSIDKQTENKLLLLQSFNLLSCIISIFLLVLRLLGIFRNGD